MKILITESQLKDLTELGGKFKKETEVIYQDRNIICYIPKSQMVSRMLGKGTHWCSNDKSGFDMWSNRGLLIRFIFRGGRKIRVTYNFGESRNENYNWANENGHHALMGIGNPFDAKPTNSQYSNELDILTHIQLIPDECKKRVLDFIQNHRERYDYCHRTEEYKTPKEKQIEDRYSMLFKNFDKRLRNLDLFMFYNRQRKTFELMNFVTHENETFRDIDSFQRRITEILMQNKTPEGV
jgi:hypothetical protein